MDDGMDYACFDCGQEFSENQADDDRDPKCPNCGSKEVEDNGG